MNDVPKTGVALRYISRTSVIMNIAPVTTAPLACLYRYTHVEKTTEI